MTTWTRLALGLLLPQIVIASPVPEAAPGTINLEQRDDAPEGYNSPAYYPTPHGGWVSDWAEAYEKAYQVVSNMTLAEKVNLTTGTGFFMGPCVGQTGSAPRFGIPNICLQDSPLGIRNSDHNTAFPPGITTGATFNKELMYARGVAIGEEARGKGVNVQLGPSVGALGRKPRGGRNWEGFGADPVLQAIGGAQTIKGMQSTGAIAALKHFIGNEQEMYRMSSIITQGYSSNIDDRTLHELYLWPFAEGVRAGVGSVMTAYNDVNSSACSQNSKLLNGVLKDELGFQGFVMTDWLGHYGGVASALAGLDMCMPGDGAVPLFGDSWWGPELSRSILNGSVPVSRLNDMVTRIVATWYKLGQDKDYPLPNFSTNTQDEKGPLYPGALFSPSGVVNQFVNVQSDHNITARAVAREAVTLLKNEQGILPLRRNDSLKVFGSDAGGNPDGLNSCNDQGCNKGVLTMGWGSGTARLPYLITPQEAIANISKTAQFYITDSFPKDVTATSKDIAVVFINADSGENYITVEGNPGDRTKAGLNAWHNGDDLVKAAAEKFSNVVVVVHTVGPILMEEWIDLKSVKAVVMAHLPGQEAGNSLTDVLFGEYSPSGHLPYSIPRSESDYPESVGIIDDQPFGQIQDTFTEGLYIDYRHFLKSNITTRYPFGHGLSYTTFKLSNPTISEVIAINSAYPPTRPVKSSTPVYNNSIPAASEVAWSSTNFTRIWRYIYPYLDNPESISASDKYPYPDGYNTSQPESRAGGGEGGNPALFKTAFTVQVTVTNNGARRGKAVPQLYVELPSSLGLDTPSLQLRQFEKTKELAPGQSETVTLEVTRKDLSVWDVEVQDWKAPVNGEGVKLWIGQSVADLPIVCVIGEKCSFQ